MKTNKIVLGTVQFGLEYGINNSKGKPDEAVVFDILNKAYQNGIRVLDTAEVYGNAVDVIGRFHAISDRRFDIVSKFTSNDYSEKVTIQDWMHSHLSRLKCDHLYGCLFHSFDDYADDSNIVEELDKLRQLGLVDKIGVSIYSNDQFEIALNDPLIKLIQLPYNLLDNKHQRQELILRANSQGVEIHTRSVFLQGLFFSNIEHLPLKVTSLIPHLKEIHKLASTYNLTMQDLALNYAVQNPAINQVLIGIDSVAQLEENITVLKTKIPDSLVKAIDKINVNDISLLNPQNWK